MNFTLEFEKWASNQSLDEELKLELEQMDEEARKDAFYKKLSFGTGGMRGVIGAGINRMNVYTLRKANYGFGKYLKDVYGEDVSRGVVIAHDNRNKSVEFAKESACVLATFGIKSYLFESLRPTPELSFAVRELKAIGGIVVTASHNPPKYNGYKIYDEDGCQLVPRFADQVVANVNSVEDLFSVEAMNYDEALDNGMVTIIGEDMDNTYLDMVDTVQLQKELKKEVKIVFTPLHGTSRMIGLKALERNGYDVTPVKEQMVVDPFFSTVASPNPENKEAFEYAQKLGLEINADILIATDPDADRLGVACMVDGDYVLLTGNQTGAILVDYVLKTRKEQGTLPKLGKVYNTIVTSPFGAKIAKAYGMEVESTLTGFKFIGEKAKEIEDTEYEFMFGYEESYGYVVKDFVRDKDSIQALLLLAEVANMLKLQGKTLYDYLLELYKEYGFYKEDLVNFVLEGASGEARIKEVMTFFRNNKPADLNGNKVVLWEDYLESTSFDGSKLLLPKSNVLKFVLEDGSWFVLRPSGTEPKLKIYVGVKGANLEDSNDKNKVIKDQIVTMINNI